MKRKEGAPNPGPYHPEYGTGPDPYAGLSGNPKPFEIELSEKKDKQPNSAAQDDYAWYKSW